VPPYASEQLKCSRKIDVRLPGKRNSNSHGARPVHLIIAMIKWIRISRLSIKNSLSFGGYISGLSRTHVPPYASEQLKWLNCSGGVGVRNVQRFRGGLVFKANRLCVSLNSRLESKTEEDGWGEGAWV